MFHFIGGTMTDGIEFSVIRGYCVDLGRQPFLVKKKQTNKKNILNVT